jgi:cellulose synthase/poly-beta-1,6-N-acetylglucosamine synthase-like glycosyltransferase
LKFLLYFLFWGSLFFVLYSYVLYPLHLAFLSKFKKKTFKQPPKDYFPRIFLLMSAHNEEKVIKKKMQSLLRLNYPHDRIFFYLGSDASSDSTDEIIASFAQQDARIRFYPSSVRRGKPGMIHLLKLKIEEDFKDELGEQDVFVFTDADIEHEVNCFRYLASHFYDSRIGLVDAHLKSHHFGTSLSTNQMEEKYMGWETLIKSLESQVYGRMMGPSGGCFAMRASLYKAVPSTFLVDDFYWAMQVLDQGYYAIIDLGALAFENRNSNLATEYNRKKRISAGNFQNLFYFKHLLYSKKEGLSYAFIAHKVLRWFVPMFLLVFLLSMLSLFAMGEPFFIFATYFILACLTLGLVVNKILDFIGKPWELGRQVFYFMAMNLALLHGFIKYLKGIDNNVWQPTTRNDNHGNSTE